LAAQPPLATLRPVQGPEGLYGYQRADDPPGSGGSWSIPPRFQAANPFGPQGLAWVRLESKFGAIDQTGQLVIPATIERVRAWSPNGLVGARLTGGLWGFINPEGRWVVEPKLKYVYPFAGPIPLARAQEADSGLFGFLDETGRWAIAPVYPEAQDFTPAGLAAVKAPKGHWGIIDAQGQWPLKPAFLSLKPEGELFLAQSQPKVWGLIDAQGQWRLKIEADILESFGDNNLAAAHHQGGWGFVDRQGRWVIKPQYLLAFPFSGGLAPVAPQNQPRFGFIDERGQWVIEPRFKFARSFGANGLAVAIPVKALEPEKPDQSPQEDNDRFGFIDLKGNWAIEPIFKWADPFEADGLAGVETLEGQWGFINAKGEMVIQGEFQRVFRFYPLGLAPALDQNKNVTFINYRGQARVPIGYDRRLDLLAGSTEPNG
jgi:hypothetical protein